MMGEFQKEVAIAIVLLTFFLGYSVYVEIARIGVTGRSRAIVAKKRIQYENTESQSFKDCELF